MHDKIRQTIEQNKDRIISLTQDLVQINSENHPPVGSEGEVQEYIASFWSQHNIDFDSFIPTDIPEFKSHPAYCDLGRSYENRPVVVAKLPGSGGGRSLILSGHVDTVPVAGGEWKFDPYSGEIEAGKLYGRGSYDMKGGVAAMMMAACLLKENDIQLQGDLIVETVPDEEFASGNGTVAARARGYMADAAVITEPTAFNIVAAQRGFRLAQITIAGKTGIPVIGGEMTNPVQHLTPILQGIESFRTARYSITKEDTIMITKLAANEFRPDELLTVPPECRIEVYWQVMPEEEMSDVDSTFESAICDVCSSDSYFETNPPQITYHLRPMPGSRIPVDAPIVREASAVIEAVMGRPAFVLDMFVPCDLFVFNKFSNIPAIVLGPSGDNAHAPNEYVVVEDLLTCAEIYMNLAVKWCGVA